MLKSFVNLLNIFLNNLINVIKSEEFIMIILKSVLLTLIVSYFSEKFKYSQKEKLQQIEKKNTQEIQREAYYKAQTGDDLNKILKEFLSLLTAPEKFGFPKDIEYEKLNNLTKQEKILYQEKKIQEHMRELLDSLIMYGSKDSILLASILMQNLYSADEKVSEECNQPITNMWTNYWIAAKLVAQLKSDYTGIDINPMHIIKIVINDLHKPENLEKIESGKQQADKLVQLYKNE